MRCKLFELMGHLRKIIGTFVAKLKLILAKKTYAADAFWKPLFGVICKNQGIYTKGTDQKNVREGPPLAKWRQKVTYGDYGGA